LQKLLALHRQTWLYIVIGLFIAINSFFIFKEFFYFGLLSIALGIAFIAFVRLDILVYLIVFVTPLSIPLRYIVTQTENDVILPTEPLILVLLLVFILKLLHEKKFDLRVVTHPISVAIFISLAWMLLTSITSTMPWVSFKFFFSRIWFLVAYYFILTQVFVHFRNIRRFYWFYIIPLVGIAVYAIIRLGTYGFSNKQAAHFVSSPFFNDHTAYGAILALIYPLIVHLFLLKGKTLLFKVFTGGLLVLFTVAIILSYTRATWLSLSASFVVFLLIKFRIQFRFILLAVVVAGIIVVSSWHEIMMKLEKNTKESSDYLVEHVQSMSNVTSDASNLERINRWASAIRMFREKPILGWGPGTYSFKYGPFQVARQKTIISTNAGVMGNAHSEYIGPLAEMGVPGLLSVLLIISVTLIHSIRLYHRLVDPEAKSLVIALIIGLVTYYIHGTLNNFLDTDKASCLFWGFSAVFVSIDLYHKDKLAPKN
jgi:putative inorganic carbon (hco3(-)) transporter